jgi:hypothetical protein
MLIDGQSIDVYVYQTTIDFVPPLAIGANATLHRSYYAAGTEAAAFSSEGSYAGVKVFYPTRLVRLQLVSPAHHRIVLISCHIVNEAGQENPIAESLAR